MTALDIAFAACAVLATASGLLAVTTNRVLHAALWLAVALGSVAGVFVILGAELVALVQILIYVGAIVVLVLFALMITHSPLQPDIKHRTALGRRILAGLVSAGISGLLIAALLPLAANSAAPHPTSTKDLAHHLFGVWVWPFEALSLLLLVALIAALAVARIPQQASAATQPDTAKEPSA